MEVDTIGSTSVYFDSWDDDFSVVKSGQSSKVSDVAEKAFQWLSETRKAEKVPLKGSVSVGAERDNKGKTSVNGEIKYESDDGKKTVTGKIERDSTGKTSGTIRGQIDFQNE